MSNSWPSPYITGTMTLGPGAVIDGSAAGVLFTLAAGTAAAPSLGVGEATTGLYRPSAGVLGFTTAGAQRMTLTAGVLALISSMAIRSSQVGGDVDILFANPAAPRQITVEDPGGNDAFVYKAATQTLTNKTFTSPTITNFSNAQHTHADNAAGGQLGQSAIVGVAGSNLGVALVLAATVNGASSVIYNADAPRGFKILDVVVSGITTHAGGTVKLDDNAGNDITDAIACDTQDAQTRAATIVATRSSIVPGGSLRVVVANAANGTVSIICQPL